MILKWLLESWNDAYFQLKWANYDQNMTHNAQILTVPVDVLTHNRFSQISHWYHQILCDLKFPGMLSNHNSNVSNSQSIENKPAMNTILWITFWELFVRWKYLKPAVNRQPGYRRGDSQCRAYDYWSLPYILTPEITVFHVEMSKLWPNYDP